MDGLHLLLAIAATAYICYMLERRVAWLTHTSAVCLIILVAMFLSHVGLVPHTSELYDLLQGELVLFSLIMMTVGLHLNDIKRLPIKIVIAFFFGAIGSTLGGVIAGLVAVNDLGVDAYKLAAQFTASYIGGGENAIAMQKMFDIPNQLFVAAFAVDNLVTSLWMAACIWYANDSEKEVSIQPLDASNFDGTHVTIIQFIASVLVGVLVIVLSQWAATNIGGIHKILYLSIFSLILGHIPKLREQLKPAYLIGAVLFSGFFFSIGAMSNLKDIFALPKVLILMPFIIVGTQGILIVAAAKLLGITRSSTSVASQALIGGPATAVAVAQARKWTSGISIGIVLGVAGYAVANFFGSALFHILNFLHPIGV